MLSKDPSAERPSLKRRVINAGLWSLGGLGFIQVVRLGSNLVLTRLLAPDMFGVMAIASMVLVGLALFSDLGLRPNVVQSRRGHDPAFLNTAWTVQILRGLLVWLFALAISLLLASANRLGLVPEGSVYADPRLPIVIGVVSLTAVISGFNSTKLFEASRNLTLARMTLIEFIAQGAGLTCMLGWAFLDRSIWALVAGNVCGALATAVLSHAWLPGTANRWQWDRSAFFEIYHFGKWIFVSSMLAFLASSGDRLMLGGMIDSATLGVYAIAVTIVSIVEAVPARLVQGAAFLALSETIRERPAALKATYYRLHAIVAPFSYLCSGALMMSGEALVALLYDQRYAQAGWMLEVLAVALLAAPFQIATQCFMAYGMPKLNSRILATRVALLLAGVPIGFHVFALPGAVWAAVLSQIFSLPIVVFYSIRFGLFDLRRELFALPMVLVGVAAGSMLTFVIRNYAYSAFH